MQDCCGTLFLNVPQQGFSKEFGTDKDARLTGNRRKLVLIFVRIIQRKTAIGVRDQVIFCHNTLLYEAEGCV